MNQKLLLRLFFSCSLVWLAGSVFASKATVEALSSLNLDNAGVVTYSALDATIATVSGKTELHITGSVPLSNSTVDLQSVDSWLYLDAVKPSTVISQYLKTKSITVNGDSIVLKLGSDVDRATQNARIAVYRQGSVIIPYGNLSDKNALQVFTEPAFGGNSKFYPIYTINTNLGAFNNAIQSFKLKKGYMATFANQVDGTGFSKVFIADDADLEMSAMPKGLEGTVSYIRVMRWDWTSQKGWAGGPGQVNATTFYDWNIGGDSGSPDWNYVPIKQKLGWPSQSDFSTKQNVNHALFYNEPDHPEQHQDDNGGLAITVAQAINNWPSMMACGLRLGSPAPTDFSWLYNFITECDKRNYRVDFVAVHAYWYTSMSSWRSQLQAVWNNTKRPVWVTEWNNGANWTGNNFPNASGPQCDADGNQISTTVVTLPSSAANIAKQKTDIQSIVTIMEDPALHIERYFIYNWVQDARALELGGKLTPAGKWYAANPSRFAFTGAYDHQWKLVMPDFSSASSTTNPSQIVFSWKDYNRETAKGYILERRIGATGAWVAISDTIPAIRTDAGASSDAAVPVITGTDILTQASYYRVKAIGYEGSIVYSGSLFIVLDPVAASPTVTATPVSSSWVKLEWNTVTNAKSYRIYRAVYPDSIYSIVKDAYTTATYNDMIGLKANTIYWYKVYSLNNRGESADAVPVKVITKKTDGTDGDGGITALNEIKSENFVLYPNPVKAGERIFIGNENPSEKFSIEIADITGKTVLRYVENKFVYAPATQGIFFVKLVGQRKTKVYKLIVK